MLSLYVWVSTWLSTSLTEMSERAERGEIGLEYVVLLAVIGGAVLLGATVLKGAVTSAFDRVTKLVNGVG